MTDDMTLLGEYARGHSEAAFAALVSRHVNLVYSVALRHVGRTHLAEEITQAVFIILARKAGSLEPRTALSGWLCRAARYTAANALTIQRRRQEREEAYMRSLSNEPETDAWTRLAPLLDAALQQLGRKDHDAIILRFFEGRSLSEVGAAMGASEDAARKRVHRAVERLRTYFARRGVVLSAAGLASAVAANSVQAAPAILAKSVTAGALTKGAAASPSTLALIKGALKIMAWTKAKTAIIAGTIILTAGTTTTWLVQHESRLKPQLIAAGETEFPRSSWHFAGFGNPESAALSMIWATSVNNGHVLRSGLSPDIERLFAGKPDSALINATAQDKAHNPRMTGYRILDKQVLSDNEVVLNIYGVGVDETDKLIFKRVGNEWKFNGKPKN